ncbi:MAG: GNAT family protein [Bacteroidota bacterium]
MKLRPFIRIDKELSLHLARPELVPAIFTAVDGQRKYLGEWLPWVGQTKKVEDTSAYIEESMRQNTNGSHLVTFIMHGEELAGSVSVVSFNKDNKSCEAGYWLHEELQGRGIMTKACRAFVDHLFKTKSLNRIEIKVAAKNLKSQAILLRLGFVREGVLREGLLINEKYHDLVLFSLLRKEWQES